MFSTLYYSWIKHCIFLFFLTFVHEDVAIVAASFSNVEYGFPVSLALCTIYLGIISGDLFIYGLGRFAQRSKWLKSKVIGPKVDQVKNWLEKNFIWAVAVCRVTPSLLFPTFVAIGWFRMSVKRFFIVSLISSAIYTPIVFLLVKLLGELVLFRLGYWAWGILMLIVILFPLRRILKSLKKNQNSSSPQSFPFLPDFPVRNNHGIIYHIGMPALNGVRQLISLAERIPNGLFYIPIGVRWIALSIRYGNFTLPTIANPLIETGGFWGESKSSILEDVGKDQQQWMANYFAFDRTNQLAEIDLEEVLIKMTDNNLAFPIVVKPDIGWQGFGVRKIDNEKELSGYLSAYPHNVRLLIQQLIPYDGEAGVFYARMPNESHGSVFSLTLRYFPHIIGDGISTLRKLIQENPRTGFKSNYYFGKDPAHVGLSKEKLEQIPLAGEMVRLAFIGSIRIGGIYRDARHLITPELSERFDEIARSIPEFYYGRFDIRFKSTELLKEAKDFSIIEINGAGSEPIHAWDPEISFFNLYGELFKTQRLLFKIAAENRKRGFKPDGFIKFLKAAKRQNQLIKRYPPAG